MRKKYHPESSDKRERNGKKRVKKGRKDTRREYPWKDRWQSSVGNIPWMFDTRLIPENHRQR